MPVNGQPRARMPASVGAMISAMTRASISGVTTRAGE